MLVELISNNPETIVVGEDNQLDPYAVANTVLGVLKATYPEYKWAGETIDFNYAAIRKFDEQFLLIVQPHVQEKALPYNDFLIIFDIPGLEGALETEFLEKVMNGYKEIIGEANPVPDAVKHCYAYVQEAMTNFTVDEERPTVDYMLVESATQKKLLAVCFRGQAEVAFRQLGGTDPVWNVQK